MEDVFASIRRMIADVRRLPSERTGARAHRPVTIGTAPRTSEAAAPQEEAPARKAPADAFLSLVHRLDAECGDQTPHVSPTVPLP